MTSSATVVVSVIDIKTMSHVSVYSTCTSLPCKLYFLTLDGRQSQVHSGTHTECPLKLAVFCEVMPPRSVTEVCQHFSAIVCLHYLP